VIFDPICANLREVYFPDARPECDGSSSTSLTLRKIFCARCARRSTQRAPQCLRETIKVGGDLRLGRTDEQRVPEPRVFLAEREAGDDVVVLRQPFDDLVRRPRQFERDFVEEWPRVRLTHAGNGDEKIAPRARVLHARVGDARCTSGPSIAIVIVAAAVSVASASEVARRTSTGAAEAQQRAVLRGALLIRRVISISLRPDGTALSCRA